ncbi:Hypothetical_protein [Hexamita inflata]|uniref:Hypothetical_protein n=1 Tax=Hexamita inflata TaxID=28002 RepID=A0AA86QWC7_9EUKA|nr:Hypothetical protein HINF_LOCUS53495 [Hexamita inflata]
MQSYVILKSFLRTTEDQIDCQYKGDESDTSRDCYTAFVPEVAGPEDNMQTLENVNQSLSKLNNYLAIKIAVQVHRYIFYQAFYNAIIPKYYLQQGNTQISGGNIEQG